MKKLWRRSARHEDKASFFRRLKPRLSPKDILDVEVAYMLAKHVHRWQTRRELDPEGHPRRYFEHLRGTALILIDEVGIVDPVLIIVCLSHDSYEDTREMTPEMLEHIFCGKVAVMVQWLSKKPKRGYDRRLRQADWQILLVKACDRLDNLRSLGLPEIDPAFRAKQLAETRKKYFPIFERMVALTPPEHAAAVSRLYDKIVATVERLERQDAV